METIIARNNFKKLIAKSIDLRLQMLESIYASGRGHIGSALSCLDILISLYHGGFLSISPNLVDSPNRDRFILSKGHAAISLYAVLADLGFFNVDELLKMNQGSMLGEHPDFYVNGIEVNSGALGHGLGVACGMALAAKIDRLSYRTVVLVGDGECHEGSIWEAAMFANHHRLNNLICIVDRNNFCVFGNTEEVNRLEPFVSKWEAFGWEVVETDGNDIPMLIQTFNRIEERGCSSPLVVIANTVKGKGVSFMAGDHKWHHGSLTEELFQLAKKELEKEKLEWI